MTEPPRRTTQSPPKLLNARQVGERLGVNAETVTDWANAGKIECVVLPSGRFRFHQETVDAILAGRNVSPS